MAENPSKTARMVRVFGKSATAQNQFVHGEFQSQPLHTIYCVHTEKDKIEDLHSVPPARDPEQKPVTNSEDTGQLPLSLAPPIGQSHYACRWPTPPSRSALPAPDPASVNSAVRSRFCLHHLQQRPHMMRIEAGPDQLAAPVPQANFNTPVAARNRFHPQAPLLSLRQTWRSPSGDCMPAVFCLEEEAQSGAVRGLRLGSRCNIG